MVVALNIIFSCWKSEIVDQCDGKSDASNWIRVIDILAVDELIVIAHIPEEFNQIETSLNLSLRN